MHAWSRIVLSALGVFVGFGVWAAGAKSGGVSAQTTSPASFTAFESGHVRPLALSPDGKLLFAVNTPDNRLEIFDITKNGLTHRESVTVGLEPVAVAAASNREVWVVNHLSDSVSIVEVSGGTKSQVTRTLLVGDEPRDIVFAGPGKRRAFVTTARRGQNSPVDPALTTPGIGRALVWVFDADALGSSLGGNPLGIISLFTDTPRALAVTPDGTRVYAAGFHTGNQTTTIASPFVPFLGGLLPPLDNADGVAVPQAGLLVKFDGSHWRDGSGRTWDAFVNFSLPDRDVFAIDANASPPVPLAGAGGSFAHVGTVLFNMAVNPVSGKVYVSNLDAKNEVRFQGPGVHSAGETVRGHTMENRITVVSATGTVAPRHLNKHIDYNSCCAPLPNAESAKSLALPTGMDVSSDGTTLYVAALGSNKIGIHDTAALENDSFVPSAANHVVLSGGGPTGLVLDEPRHRLYVLTRFDNAISIVDTGTRTETGHVEMANPEPASITVGRRFLYDASLTSSHGDTACASCHVFGDLDSLAWDLGNPDAAVTTSPGPFSDTVTNFDVHPMKGPMVTQSLRGLANHGPMQWRGDLTGGNDEPSAQPDAGSFNERLAFQNVGHKFQDLLGRSQPLTSSEMAAFADFILQLTYPPNPNASLDGAYTADQQHGRDLFFTTASSALGAGTCQTCHPVDPQGNAAFGVASPGFFGSDGHSSKFAPQIFKNPHLRNQYQKVGMFGFPVLTGFQGDQIRGFGFYNDGSLDTLISYMTIAASFGFTPGLPGIDQRRKVESFLLAFPTNLAPIVGQQITLSEASAPVVGPRIDLMRARADAGECDLIVKGRIGGRERGYLYTGGTFIPDKASGKPVSDAELRNLAVAGHAMLTYTCVPPGSGIRAGIDRDLDGILDGDDHSAQ